MRYSLLLMTVIFAILGCRKDDTLLKQKMFNYLTLCPTGGITACYDNCGTANNIGGSPTGSQMAAYETCKGSCDSYCNLGYLLLLSQ